MLVTFVIADRDADALALAEKSLKQVSPNAQIAAFTDALSAYKFCVNHAREITLVLLAVVLKPIDGFKLHELISTLPIPLNVVFMLKDESEEMLELVKSNGGCRWIAKPVTAARLLALASETLDLNWRA